MTPVELLVQRLRAKPAGAGPGYVALCPAHEDHEPSLSIDEGVDGRALLRCHAGCSTENVIAASGLTMRDLFPGTPHYQSGNGSTTAPAPAFDWDRCVADLTDEIIASVAKWRGFAPEFLQELKRENLIGLHETLIAFPVKNNGAIVGTHRRLRNGNWLYTKAIKAAPLVFGELTPGEPMQVFESTWDGLDYMDKSGERNGVIITRGSGNGKLAKVIPANCTVYLWPQNDPVDPKHPDKDTPALTWEKDVRRNINPSCTLKRVKIPAQHKDLNDWTKAGATADDLLEATVKAEVVRESEPVVNSTSPAGRASAGFEGFAGEVPFPLRCLTPPLEAMATAVCETERVPESLAGSCALGILSSSIGAGLQIQSAPNRATRGNLYILASAESGSGKSETFRHLAKPFQNFEHERLLGWKKLTRPGLLAERDILESEIGKLKKDVAKEPTALGRDEIRQELESKRAALETVEEKLRQPILSCEDVTTEKLAVLLAHNGEQLASLSADALSIVNILLGRYSSLDRTDESLYLKAFSGDACRVDRMSRESISLESPCLVALWLTQPDKLDSLLMEQSLSEGGLIPRILACHTNCQPREIADNVPAIPLSIATTYADLIRSLLTTYRLASEPQTIYPTPEALRAMNAHHNAIVVRRRGELRDVTSFAARWNEMAWRIAVCLHAAQYGAEAHCRQLDLGTAQRAITVADWFADRQLEILNAGRTQRKFERLQKLKDLIVQQYSGKATLRDLHRRNGFEPDETRELAAAFPNVLALEKRETGGRPTEIVSLLKK
jgi:Protein of unknown function (DUF3987)